MSKNVSFTSYSVWHVNKVKWFQVFLCITNNSIEHQSFIYTQLNVKIVLFRTIQLSMSMQFSSIWPIDRNLTGATSPGQSGPGSDSNEEVLSILQISSISAASPSDCLVSYPGHSLEGVLPLYRETVGVFYCLSRLGQRILVEGVLLLYKDAASVFYSLSRLAWYYLCENSVNKKNLHRESLVWFLWLRAYQSSRVI